MVISSVPMRILRLPRAEVVEADYDERAERLFDRLVLVAVVEFLIIAAGVGVLALQAAGLHWPR